MMIITQIIIFFISIFWVIIKIIIFLTQIIILRKLTWGWAWTWCSPTWGWALTRPDQHGVGRGRVLVQLVVEHRYVQVQPGVGHDRDPTWGRVPCSCQGKVKGKPAPTPRGVWLALAYGQVNPSVRCPHLEGGPGWHLGQPHQNLKWQFSPKPSLQCQMHPIENIAPPLSRCPCNSLWQGLGCHHSTSIHSALSLVKQ